MFDDVERFYKLGRWHSTLGCLSRVDYEKHADSPYDGVSGSGGIPVLRLSIARTPYILQLTVSPYVRGGPGVAQPEPTLGKLFTK